MRYRPARFPVSDFAPLTAGYRSLGRNMAPHLAQHRSPRHIGWIAANSLPGLSLAGSGRDRGKESFTTPPGWTTPTSPVAGRPCDRQNYELPTHFHDIDPGPSPQKTGLEKSSLLYI